MEQRLGLSDAGIRARIVRIASNKHVRVTSVDIDGGDAETLLTNFENAPTDPCMTQRVAQLETGGDAMRARANAWAVGDLDLLRTLPYPEGWDACNSSMLGSQRYQELSASHDAAWLAVIDAALANNSSTFALLPMWEVQRPHGWLEKLRERGYTVEAPL